MSFTSSALSANRYIVTHTVGPNQQGIRLDTFLKQFYHRRSRENLKRAIHDGSVSIRRAEEPHLHLGRLKPSSHLLVGDEVQLLRERHPEPAVNFNYRILFEDDCLFIIEKPANLPVHPAGIYFFNTLWVHLKTKGHSQPLKMGEDYFLVHRIDKETSGILALAKTTEACTALVKQFSERSTEKRYLAIVHGAPPDEFTVDQPLLRSAQSLIKLKMLAASESEGGSPALTRFRRLKLFKPAGVNGQTFSLLECFPKTGRQHQIRIHLECAGFPIVGDKLYGRPMEEALSYYNRKILSPEAEARLLLPRHALHAAGLCFQHPISGKRLEFRSELPEDLQSFLDGLPSNGHQLDG